MASLLVEEYPSIDALLAASKEQLAGVKGFGPRRAESIYNFFHSPAGEKLITGPPRFRREIDRGRDAAKVKGGALDGKTVVVTGTLQNYGRKEIEDTIKLHGGKATSSVSKNTDYVVVGDTPAARPTRLANSVSLY